MKEITIVIERESQIANDTNFAVQEDGMDLRDYFAAQALNAFLLKLTEDYVMSDVAIDCYSVADEMMKERDK